MKSDPHYEVVVAGGGPAGLAAAIALQQGGFRCAVFDGQQPPVDKACGEGLMPDALRALAALGVVMDAHAGAAIHGIRFRDAQRSASACFREGAGMGVRRTELHARMIARAQQLGVALYWSSSLGWSRERELTCKGNRIRYKWLVIADGQRSTLSRGAGFAPRRAEAPRFALRQHYRVAPWTDHVEVYWGEKKQVYVTPVGDEEIGVAVLSADRPVCMQASLAEFPELHQRLRGATASSRARGYVTSNRHLDRVCNGCVALIGDASGSVDAITGEGLAIAFQQALAFPNAIAAGKLARYQRAHRRLERRPWTMAKLLLALDASPWLRATLMSTLSRKPELFAPLLAVHTGACSWTEFVVRHGFRFAWNTLSSLLRSSTEGYAPKKHADPVRDTTG